MSETTGSCSYSILQSACRNEDLSRAFADFVDLLDVAVWHLDPTYRIVSCNSKALQVYGEGLIGKYCYSVTTGKAGVCDNCPVQQVYGGQGRSRAENVHYDRHGNRLFVEHIATPIHDDTGQIAGVLTLLVDITDKRTEEAELRRQKEVLEKTAREKTTALAESEKKFALAFDASPDAININRLEDGLYVEINQGFTELTGYTVTDVAGKTSLEIDIWHDPKDRRELVRRLRTAGYCANLQAVFRRKDGSLTTALMSARVITLEKQEYIISITRDISEIKEMERQIGEQKTLFETMFNAIDDGIVITDTARNILLANDAMVRMFGYSRDELLGKSTAMLYAERGDYDKSGTLLFGNGNPPAKVQYVAAYRHKSGRQFPCATFGARLFDVQGEWIGNLGIRRDITEQQKSEAERDKLVSAVQQTDQAIVITDRQGTIEFVNDAFEEITGYTREEVVGANPNILKSGKHDEEFYAQMWQTISSGRIFKGRMINQRKDGALYTEEASIAPVFSPDGTIVHYIGVKKDISEQLVLERQLQQAQKMESIGRLTGGVAHDFNNILGVIHGYAEMALEKIPPESSIHADLETILEAAERSAAIIRQLLAFTRQQTVAPKRLDLNATVEGMLKMLRRLIGENIHLQWYPCGRPLPIKIDPSQVDQVLANLCVNAKDAIEEQGAVTIETALAEFDEGYCEQQVGFRPGCYVMLAVSDNGRGIAENNLSQVFEPFYTTKKLGQGTGLGLSTVYGVVKQNNGFVNIYSEQGQGTTVKIYLPLCQEHEEEKPLPKAAPPLRRGGERILLVEDDAAIRRMITVMLSKMGYAVSGAATPSQALEMARQGGEGYHLLLTDVILPEMNGRELAGRIQQLLPAIGCLYMSGYTTNVIVNKGVLGEGLHFIQKPFSRNSLAEKVREALGNTGG